MAERLRDTVCLSDVEGGRANNLTLIRFVLASGVVLTHSDTIARYGHLDPMRDVFRFNANLGDIAVFSFFFISGYLILKSALRKPDPVCFLRARFLRIFPGLATAVLLLTFVVGPIFSSLSAHDYFHQWGTWRYLTTIVLNHGAGLELPGLFSNHNDPETNLPVWTLSSEWFMYLMALLTAMLLRGRDVKGFVAAYGWAILAGAFLLTAQMMPLPVHYSWKWMLSFGFGGCVYLLRQRIPLSFPAALPLFLVSLILIRVAPVLGKPAFLPALFYLILVLGFHPTLYAGWFERIGDLSYGIYIYTWPIQQIYSDHTGSSLKICLLSYVTVLPIAALSWHFIESPCLALKTRSSLRKAVETGIRVAW